MDTLPQELIHAVTDYISSTTDLLTLREVNRKFKAVAEPRAFRVVHCTIYATSVQGLNNIHESDALRHFVKEIILHYEDMELVGPEPEKAMMEELESDDEWGSAEVQERMDEYNDEKVSDAGSMGESEDEHFDEDGLGEDERIEIDEGRLS
jgi:hypothetical protein